MAKAHTSTRPLTPEEQARRKKALGKGDSDETEEEPGDLSSGNYDRRVALAATAHGPMAVDYDRDGYPDAIVGRSGRNLTQRASAVSNAPGNPVLATASQIISHRGGGTLSRGTDGFGQGQIGYRDRLRARLTAAAAVEDADEDDPIDPKVRAMAGMPVLSHGGTGVPGARPASSHSRPVVLGPGPKPYPTPLEQAKMAPRTPITGFQNTGAQKLTTIAVPPPGSGVPGRPGGTVRRASYGNVPAQGTSQPGGAFVVHGAGEAEEPEEPGEGKSKAKPHEPAKAHEHAKPHEPAKAHEHAKHPEHHDKK
jgi:hypothetical protein